MTTRPSQNHPCLLFLVALLGGLLVVPHIQAQAVPTVIAGGGVIGSPCNADGTSALGTKLSGTTPLAVDLQGNLFFAETCLGASLVRRIDASTGLLSTVAGKFPAVYTPPVNPSGDGGPATEAVLLGATTIAVGPEGDLYIASINKQIRMVSGATGTITTYAGIPYA